MGGGGQVGAGDSCFYETRLNITTRCIDFSLIPLDAPIHGGVVVNADGVEITATIVVGHWRILSRAVSTQNKCRGIYVLIHGYTIPSAAH